MAKAYVGEAAVESALDAVQIHGGWGYVDEFHVERSLRDAKLATATCSSADASGIGRVESGDLHEVV